MTCNTAVFYDVENLSSIFSPKNNQTLQLDEIHRRILDLDVVQGISVQRAYADWIHPVNRNLRGYILQLGIEPIQIFNTNKNDRVKNAADVSLIIDAVELIARNPEIENYVITSGDGIFAFLAKKLHNYGKRVIGCGFDRYTNINFKNACDIFLALDKPEDAASMPVKNVSDGSILTGHVNIPVIHSDPDPTAVPLKPKPVVQEVVVPNKLPKTKFTDALVKSDIPVWRNSRDLPGSLHTMKRMINVLFEDTVKEDGKDIDLEISVFKAYVDHYLPNFRIRHYGFKRFGEFMRFLVSGSPYCLTVSEGTVVRIVKRDVPYEEHTVMEDIDTLQFTLADGEIIPSIFDVEDGVPFYFDLEGKKPQIMEAAISPAKKAASKKAPKKGAAKKETDAKAEAGSNDINIVGTASEADTSTVPARTLVKDSFTRFSQENKLSSQELKKLTTASYSQKTFGVTVPVLKEIKSRVNLREQRLENGRIKYWKDEMVFNGKEYFVFKEWTEKAHRAKFEAWLGTIE